MKRRPADEPRRKISRRRSLALWGLGLLSAAHAALYIHVPAGVPLPPGLQLLDDAVPLSIVSWGWAAAAVPMLWCAATRRPGWAPAALTFLMVGIWGTSYAAGVVFALFEQQPARSFLLACVYASVQLIMFSSIPKRDEHDDPPQTMEQLLPRTAAMLDRTESVGDAQ